MLHQRSPLEALGEGAAIRLPLAALLRFKAMQLPLMPVKWRYADHAPIIGHGVAAYGAIRQHPGINAMRLPHFGQLLTRFLQAQLVP